MAEHENVLVLDLSQDPVVSPRVGVSGRLIISFIFKTFFRQSPSRSNGVRPMEPVGLDLHI